MAMVKTGKLRKPKTKLEKAKQMQRANAWTIFLGFVAVIVATGLSWGYIASIWLGGAVIFIVGIAGFSDAEKEVKKAKEAEKGQERESL